MPSAASGEAEAATLRLTLEYDGGRFHGFQWQPSERTVAGVLESALAKIFGGPVKIAAAGRTDAGVHATGQVVSFSASKAFAIERLPAALNGSLSGDLTVREAGVAPRGFSARRSAVERTYVYAISNRAQPSALLRHYVHHVRFPLDLVAMQAAAGALVGRHDFRSFCAYLPDGGETVRTVRTAEVSACGELVRIEVAANGFLHRMVRTIVGTLIECGTGRRPSGSLPSVLAARDRSAAGLTAPPQGLYLAGVRFTDGYDSFREPPVFVTPKRGVAYRP